MCFFYGIKWMSALRSKILFCKSLPLFGTHSLLSASCNKFFFFFLEMDYLSKGKEKHFKGSFPYVKPLFPHPLIYMYFFFIKKILGVFCIQILKKSCHFESHILDSDNFFSDPEPTYRNSQIQIQAFIKQILL